MISWRTSILLRKYFAATTVNTIFGFPDRLSPSYSFNDIAKFSVTGSIVIVDKYFDVGLVFHIISFVKGLNPL